MRRTVKITFSLERERKKYTAGGVEAISPVSNIPNFLESSCGVPNKTQPEKNTTAKNPSGRSKKKQQNHSIHVSLGPARPAPDVHADGRPPRELRRVTSASTGQRRHRGGCSWRNRSWRNRRETNAAAAAAEKNHPGPGTNIGIFPCSLFV